MILACLALWCTACEKDNDNEAVNPGLQIRVTHSTTTSGMVEFEATAPNATGYSYDFGDGTTAASTDGKASHTFTKIGTNTFYVVVKATNASGTTETKTVAVVVSIAASLPGLIWADEFEGSGAPNPVNWTFETGGGGWGNNELQFYTNRPQNASVSGGMLKINLIKESYNGAAYTSARLVTKDKFDFKYGRVEARAKLPVGGGTWPAIWALGHDINTVGWPACGEIDIMEHVGNQQNKIHGTLHYPGRSGGNAHGSSITIPNVSTAFHVYKLDWSAASIKFYVDDQLFFNVTNTAAIPFNKDFFMIVNVAMGGNFGGAVDPAFTSSSMEIDYIRVFSN